MRFLLKYSLFCFLAFASCLSFAQTNLVPNPSFEDTVNCPIIGNINDANQWYNPTTYSPDYYHSCVPSSGPGDGFSTPNNWYGIQNARTGIAYAGIITGFIGCNCREYIQAKLTDTLDAGKKYCVSFYVCLTDSSPFAVNDIGAYFSNTAVSSGNIFNLPYTPQIANDPVGNPLTIRNTWIQITDTFYATGGELYITLGNFYNDANTDTTEVAGGGLVQYGYYYIDDISVINCDSLNNIFEMKNDEMIFIYPNPSDGIIHLTSIKKINGQITLFNIYGERLFSDSINLNQNMSINLTSYNSGIYLLQFTYDNKIVQKTIIIY